MSSSTIFNWNSSEQGKAEYHDFMQHFQATLGIQSLAHVISNQQTDLVRPTNLHGEEPPINNATRNQHDSWLKLKQTYLQQLKTFHKEFNTAIGILTSLFPYPSLARSTIEEAMLCPLDILPSDWLPENRFRAAMQALTSQFAPTNATDVNALRLQLRELNDIKVNGFQEFTKLLVQLTKAGHAPAPIDLREWVLKGIRNSEVNKMLASYIVNVNQEPSYLQIFEVVRGFLKRLNADNDPYKTTYASPGKPIVSASAAIVSPNSTLNTAHKLTCTRCWRTGHLWKQCVASTCSACGTTFKKMAFCPNYQSHKDPKVKWSQPHLVKASQMDKNSVGTKRKSSEDP